jgi:hypothetical protein
MDTLPKVLSICFPGLPVKWNKTDYFVTLPNGSEIWLCGLDDSRVEKILGMEFSTLYFNEASELNYTNIQTVISRLAERNNLTKRVWFDFNPPAKSHWSYWLFIKQLDPIESEPLENPEDYGHILMNPRDNMANIDEEYLKILSRMPEKDRERFLEGKFSESDDGAAYYAFDRELHVKDTKLLSGELIINMDFNKLYDVFYKAGVPVGSMRVASPFMSEAKSSLSLYKVIDPHIWARLCARVGGANFVATYGKQLTYKSFSLPKGHTWKSFVKFLLKTLPEQSSENFKNRFIQSIVYWARVGRGLDEGIINQLIDQGIKIKVNGFTAHGSKTLTRVRILNYPDHLDFLKSNHSSVASWKRLAITILKNDHTCKYLGLAPTKEMMVRQKQIMRKYKNVNIKGEVKK